ncbi:MAG: HAD family hydrolase [Ruminococcus sp.]|nr:HAD family hydrolase [Ruminococcus sp.]
MYNNILFDLDGTLLPMDMEAFTKLYFGSLCKRFCPIFNIEADALINAVWKGTSAMMKNDNSRTNKEVFWEVASKECNMDLTPYIEQFDDYYLSEFIAAKQATQTTPFAKKCVELVRDKLPEGGKLIAATNPIFPEVATMRRLNWAEVSPNYFDHITAYENSGFCKPNLEYYKMICDKCGIKPEESLMIGNDVDEDMVAAELGFDTYLVTDTMINRQNKDYSKYKHGTFEELFGYLAEVFR